MRRLTRSLVEFYDVHYPVVFAGLTFSRGRCVCGWRGERRWGISRCATNAACEDYFNHLPPKR